MTNRHASKICILLLSLAVLVTFLQAQGLAGVKQKQQGSRRSSAEEEEKYVPVGGVVSLAEMPPHQPFEVCSGCRCCSRSNSSNCLDTRCCFAIKGNLPGKPFGRCAFSPVTCACNNCVRPPAGVIIHPSSILS